MSQTDDIKNRLKENGCYATCIHGEGTRHGGCKDLLGAKCNPKCATGGWEMDYLLYEERACGNCGRYHYNRCENGFMITCADAGFGQWIPQEDITRAAGPPLEQNCSNCGHSQSYTGVTCPMAPHCQVPPNTGWTPRKKLPCGQDKLCGFAPCPQPDCGKDTYDSRRECIICGSEDVLSVVCRDCDRKKPSDWYEKIHKTKGFDGENHWLYYHWAAAERAQLQPKPYCIRPEMWTSCASPKTDECPKEPRCYLCHERVCCLNSYGHEGERLCEKCFDNGKGWDKMEQLKKEQTCGRCGYKNTPQCPSGILVKYNNQICGKFQEKSCKNCGHFHAEPQQSKHEPDVTYDGHCEVETMWNSNFPLLRFGHDGYNCDKFTPRAALEQTCDNCGNPRKGDCQAYCAEQDYVHWQPRAAPQPEYKCILCGAKCTKADLIDCKSKKYIGKPICDKCHDKTVDLIDDDFDAFIDGKLKPAPACARCGTTTNLRKIGVNIGKTDTVPICNECAEATYPGKSLEDRSWINIYKRETAAGRTWFVDAQKEPKTCLSCTQKPSECGNCPSKTRNVALCGNCEKWEIDSIQSNGERWGWCTLRNGEQRHLRFDHVSVYPDCFIRKNTKGEKKNMFKCAQCGYESKDRKDKVVYCPQCGKAVKEEKEDVETIKAIGRDAIHKYEDALKRVAALEAENKDLQKALHDETELAAINAQAVASWEAQYKTVYAQMEGLQAQLDKLKQKVPRRCRKCFKHMGTMLEDWPCEYYQDGKCTAVKAAPRPLWLLRRDVRKKERAQRQLKEREELQEKIKTLEAELNDL